MTTPATPSKPISWYARRYVERFGFHLVPIEPKRKFPRAADWGNQCLTTAQAAADFYDSKPDWNMGVALGPSRVCSLDIDCLDSFRLICECFGIDLDALIASTPTIQGASKGMRLMFRVPASLDALPYHKLNWHSRNDPDGSKHRAAMDAAKAAKDAGDTDRETRIRRVAKRWAMYTVFELRSAGDGKQRQDVLPPSIHPDTGRPYRWVTQPREDWPTPPGWLLAIWQDYEPFRKQMMVMCPWHPEQDTPPDVPAKANKASAPVQFKGDGIIDQYVREVAIEQALSDYGYRLVGQRWLSPHSSTGLPGVVVLPDKNACWIHHASDPLCSDETGRPVNPFDLFCYYEHGGDVRRAVASLRGESSVVVDNRPSVAVGAAPVPPNTPSRDLMTPLPWTNDKGKPLKHIDNLREICRRLGVVVRYNVIAKDEEIIIPGESFTMDNKANASLAWLASECSLYQFPTDKLGEFITYLADSSLYNPVARWIDSKPWDGVSRLPELYATVTARGEPDTGIRWLKETLIKRWMISAIAGAYSPTGVSAAGVLVFQGAQYLGKTKWFKTLVPAELGLLKDGMLLRPDDKDSVKQACSFWLVELGELDATFRKSDIAALKSFITNDSDVLRRAYARRESHFARRTVFFGSVNPREFLHDPTGNRRYWTIECEALDHSHDIDMQQLWAEVKALWQGGEGYYLTPEEMDALNRHNADFMAPDPIEEKILGGLAWDAPVDQWRWAQASAVLAEVGIERPSRADAATASTLIRSKNGDQAKKSNGRKLLLCPPLPLRAGY